MNGLVFNSPAPIGFSFFSSMTSPSAGPVGVAIVKSRAEMGSDYIEQSLSTLTALSASAFARLVGRIDRFGDRCETCNDLSP
jgi:hypothetical protein